ncbi:uncharacterized protein FSUBG_1046 [Fusarium subglutinans]|uniref:Uncharacterized protein n=1 Tax=Gibberella subglutinans TaxID=42677 RepID=A0A8H5QCK0_GIBSU|nr:uncharacterized protein FSUBG_1046 [Fusarium subglutinans]KAF5613316.1 hypothetical protein FSUBG_1046 [Fusarium subglutinans]
MDPNAPRCPKRASEGPYNLRKRTKTVQYADNPPRKKSEEKRVPGGRQQRQQRIWEHDETCQLLAHFQWSFSNGVDFWTTAFPKFQDTVQRAFTDEQAKKQLQHILSQHGQMEGEDDYANLFESGLDSLNLPEDLSRKVDQFLNCIPDSSTGQSKDDARAKCCLKRLLVTFLVSSEKLKAILPNEEGTKTTGLVDQGSSVDAGQPIAEQQPSQASSPLGSTDQLVENQSPKRGFVDPLPPDRRDIVEIETRLIASEIENGRLKRDLAEHYKPDAVVLNTLQEYMQRSHMRALRIRNFNPNNPGLSSKEISDMYLGLFSFMQNACAIACRDNSEAPEEQDSHSDLVESWALNTFRRELKDCISQVRESKLLLEKLLLGLVGSAVIEMIFEPAFPAFIQAPNPVAEAYRELILHISGPNELHKADRDVLPQLIVEHKTEIIKRKVDELERILYKHLDFFWVPPNGGTEDGGEVSRPDVDFRSFLEEALDFKLELTLTTTRLKYFYYEPDETFDDTRMERCMFSDRENNTIKACLFPLLLHAPVREETHTSKDIVLEYNTKYSTYFRRIFEGSHLDLEPASKAVVLT